MNPSATVRRHPKIARVILARPRLFACIVLGMATALLLPSATGPQITRAIIGWNTGAVAYLLLSAHMMFSSSHERMRTRATSQDDGRLLILAMVVVAALAALAAIVGELSVGRSLHGGKRYFHIIMAMATLVTSWAFTQVMFALHYAHDYYAAIERKQDGGLAFPSESAPDYADFLYFACVIGTSGQTADVAFTSRAMRRTGLVHCVLAYFFNATLLALTINVASGLL